jgi:hypothetical protein
MSDVRLVGTVDEEVFAAPMPCKTEALLRFVAWGTVVECVDDVEGGREVEFIIDLWAPEGVAVLDGVADVEWGVKEVFLFIGRWPTILFWPT